MSDVVYLQNIEIYSLKLALLERDVTFVKVVSLKAQEPQWRQFN